MKMIYIILIAFITVCVIGLGIFMYKPQLLSFSNNISQQINNIPLLNAEQEIDLGNLGSASIITDKEWNKKYSTDTDFEVYIVNEKDKTTEICLVVNDDSKCGGQTGETKCPTKKVIYDDKGNCILDDKGKKCIELPKKKVKLDDKKKIKTKEVKQETDRYGYCAKLSDAEMKNVGEYIRFGEHSTVLEYEDESKIQYDFDNGQVNLTSKNMDLPEAINNISISIVEDKLKFAGYDNLAVDEFELHNYTYTLDSTNPITRFRNGIEVYEGEIGVNGERHYFDFKDVCGREFNPINVSYIETLVNNSIEGCNESFGVEDVIPEYCFYNVTKWRIETTKADCDFNIQENTAIINFISNRDIDPSAEWHNDSYNFRKTINVSNTNIDSTLTNFPLLVKFKGDTDIQSHTTSTGNGIRFTNASGYPLAYEKEFFNGTDGIFWVKVPTLSASQETEVYMYYGNRTASAGLDGSDKTNVWDNSYIFVHHLAETTGSYLDSTSNGNNGTWYNRTSELYPAVRGYVDNGTIGNGIFVEDNDEVRIPDSASLDNYATTSEYSMSAWFRTWKVTQGSDRWIISRYSSGINGADHIMAAVSSATDNFGVYMRGDTWRPSGVDVTQGNDVYPDGGTWYYGVVTFNETRQLQYVNGSLALNTAKSLNLVGSSTDMSIGLSANGASGDFSGAIDEARFSSIVRSPEWIKFEYYNQRPFSDNELTFGSQEDLKDYVNYNKSIIIDSKNIDSDLTDFPLYVPFNDTDVYGNSTVGYGIWFEDGNGNVLPHEVELYNTSGTSHTWVKGNFTSASNTTIYIFYSQSQTDLEDAVNVWDSDYLMVQHLDFNANWPDYPGQYFLPDSTSNNEDLATAGTANYTIGRIDGGGTYDGNSDYMATEKPDGIEGLSYISLSTWAYFPSQSDANEDTIFSKWVTDNYGFLLRYDSANNQIDWYVGYDSDFSSDASINTVTVEGGWHYVTATWNTTDNDLITYLDGSALADTGSYTTTATIVNPSDNDLMRIGALSVAIPADYFTGSLDEVRVSNIEKTADWIKFEFYNMNSSNNEIIFGAEEEPPAPSDNPPVSTLSLPVNNTNYNTSQLVTFECNATDDINLKNVTLNVWNPSGTLNHTNFSEWTGLENSTTFTYEFTDSGIYEWNCQVFDDASQTDWDESNWTVNVTTPVVADTTPPSFDEIPDYENINYGEYWDGIDINASDETEFDSFSIDNPKFSINSSGYLNQTELLGTDTYYINITINDSSNNLNSTMYEFTVYTGVYSLGLTSPESTYYEDATGVQGTGCPSQITCDLYRNDTGIISEPDSDILGAGYYNYTYNTSGNQNYSAQSVSSIEQVQKNSDHVLYIDVGEGDPVYPALTNIGGSNCPSQLTCYLNRNGTGVISNPDDDDISAGYYNYTYNTTGNDNYTYLESSSEVHYLKADSVSYLYLNNTRSDITIENGSSIDLTGNKITGEGVVSLYVDDVFTGSDSINITNNTLFDIEKIYNITSVYYPTENYTQSSETWLVNSSVSPDTTPPYFTNITDLYIYNNQSVNWDLDANDETLFDCFTVNNTDFDITCAGLLTNVSALTPNTYYLNITINDSSNNLNTTQMIVNVSSTPSFIPTGDLILNMTFNNDSVVGEDYSNPSLGDIVVDYSNYSNNGSTNGNLFYQPNGGFSGSGSFDFTEDKYINVSAPFDYNTSSASLYSWFKSNSTDGTQMIASLRSYRDSNWRQSLSIYLSSGEIKGRCQTTVSDATISTGLTIEIDKWYLVTTVYNNSDCIMYINDTEVSSTSLTGDLITDGRIFQIGRQAGYDFYYLNGSIDEVVLYNATLTQTNISQIYNDSLPYEIVYGCRDLNVTNQSYRLESDIVHSSSGDCFNISESGINVDLNNRTITYGDNNDNSNRVFVAEGLERIAVSNGSIIHLNNDEDTFGYDIPFRFIKIRDSEISNIHLTTNATTSSGINLKEINNSLIKNNTIINYEYTQSNGIFIQNDSFNNVIENNNIETNCAVCHGIRIDGNNFGFSNRSSQNNTIRYNIVNMTSSDGWGIFMKNGADNNSIYENNVTVDDITSYGLQIARSTGNEIYNNSIYSDNGISYWITASSDEGIKNYPISTQDMFNNTLYNDNKAEGKNINVTTLQDNLVFNGQDFTMYGQVIFVNLTNLTVINSNFTDDSLTLFGVQDSNVSGNTIETNNSYGIWGSDFFDNNFITNNFINLTRREFTDMSIFSPEGASGIHIREDSFNTVIDNNVIYIEGMGNIGIQIKDGSGFNISNNLVNVTNGSMGIYMWGSDNSTIYNNQVNTSGNSLRHAVGLFIQTSSNMSLDYNDINTNGYLARGIYLYDDVYNTNLSYNEVITQGSTSNALSVNGEAGDVNDITTESNNFSGGGYQSSSFGIYTRTFNFDMNNDNFSSSSYRVFSWTSTRFININNTKRIDNESIYMFDSNNTYLNGLNFTINTTALTGTYSYGDNNSNFTNIGSNYPTIEFTQLSESPYNATRWDNGTWIDTGTVDELNVTIPPNRYIEVLEYIEVDNNPPYFTDLRNISIEDNNSLSEDFDAIDSEGNFDSWLINWTTVFSIDSIGTITNISAMPIGTHYINLSVNDTFGNTNSSVITIEVNESVLIDNLNPYFIDTPNIDLLENDTIESYYNASDDYGLSCWTVNNTDFSINCSGYITNTTAVLGEYYLNLTINDTSNNLNTTEVLWNISSVIYTDTINPYFIDINNVSQLNNETLNEYFNASDSEVFDCWSVNDSDFSINCSGYLTNTTSLDLGKHWINLTINDSYNNLNTTEIFIEMNDSTVVDNTSPYFTNVTDLYIYDNQSVNWYISADDETGLSCFTVNNTDFNINCSGYLTNVSALSPATYYLNITINDTSNNLNTTQMIVNVSDSTVYDLINPYFIDINDVHIESNQSVNEYYNATDETSFDCFSVNDTLNFMINCSGYFTNITGLSNQLYYVNITINDSSNNLNSSIVLVNVTEKLDKEAPSFSLDNLYIYDNQSVYYDVNATDNVQIDTYSINWSGTFSINKTTGVITNTSGLSTEKYYISVSVNDTSGNSKTDVMFIDVSSSFIPDTTPPTFNNLRNFSQQVNLPFSNSITASDLSGISSYNLNDTSIFSIDGVGLITNTTNLSTVEIHWINLSVNDTVGNLNSGIFYINITPYIPPVLTGLSASDMILGYNADLIKFEDDGLTFTYRR